MFYILSIGFRPCLCCGRSVGPVRADERQGEWTNGRRAARPAQVLGTSGRGRRGLGVSAGASFRYGTRSWFPPTSGAPTAGPAWHLVSGTRGQDSIRRSSGLGWEAEVSYPWATRRPPGGGSHEACPTFQQTHLCLPPTDVGLGPLVRKDPSVPGSHSPAHPAPLSS